MTEIGERRVLLSTPVTGVTVDDRLARVRLANGKTLEAEDVIVTVPPSVWNKIAFDPVLPASLAPQMGTNVKCLIAVRDAFWRREDLAADTLSDGPVNQTWHGTDGQPGAGEAFVAFSGGPSADVCRSWPAQTSLKLESYLAELSKVYKGLRPAFVRGRFMDWPSDVWAKASYSFPAPGQVTSQGPLLWRDNSRLRFAGEHTSYAFMGYMEGALHSGALVGPPDRGARRRGREGCVGCPPGDPSCATAVSATWCCCSASRASSPGLDPAIDPPAIETIEIPTTSNPSQTR